MTPATYLIEKTQTGFEVCVQHDSLLQVGQRLDWWLDASQAFMARDDFANMVRLAATSYSAYYRDVHAVLSIACDELMDVYGYDPAAIELPF